MQRAVVSTLCLEGIESAALHRLTRGAVALGTAFRLAGGAAGVRGPKDPALPIVDDVSMGGGDHGPGARAIHPELVAHFAVFRRSQSDRDLADDVTPGPPATERFGLLPSQVRLVSVSSWHKAWVTPGTRGAALSRRSEDRDGGYSTGTWSGPAESVASRGLSGWSESLEVRQTFYGLVPDGNQDVTLNLLDGEILIVPVVENVFVVSPPGRVRSVEFLNAAGMPDIRALA